MFVRWPVNKTVLSYLNSASESVLLEFFFLLHSPGTLMLLQTWSYRWCLQRSGKWMNPSVSKAVTAVSDRAPREVCPESTLASTGCIPKQGAEQAESVSLGGLEEQRQIKARSHTTTSFLYLCRELSSTNTVPYILWKYSSLKEPSKVLPLFMLGQMEKGMVQVWSIDSPHLSFHLTWELKVLIQEMKSISFKCLPSFF